MGIFEGEEDRQRCTIEAEEENEEGEADGDQRSTRRGLRSGMIGIDRQVRLSIVNQPSDC